MNVVETKSEREEIGGIAAMNTHLLFKAIGGH